ncbi:hypothetical protein D3C72_1613520 [compost metagenome]
MHQTRDGAEAELRLKPEPDVAEHQQNGCAQSQQAASEQLARDLGADDAGAREGDLADSVGDALLNARHDGGLILVVRHLETDDGALVAVDVLDLDFAQIEIVHGFANLARVN